MSRKHDGWIIKPPWDIVCPWAHTYQDYRSECIKRFDNSHTNHTWEMLYRRGFRCVKVWLETTPHAPTRHCQCNENY